MLKRILTRKNLKAILNLIIKLLVIVLIILSIIAVLLVGYKQTNFESVTLDEIGFYLTNNLEGANQETFRQDFVNNLPIFFLLSILLVIPLINFNRKQLVVSLKIKNKTFNINPFMTSIRWTMFYGLFIVLIVFAYADSQLKIRDYTRSLREESKLFEDNYVDPQKVKLTFPDKKRNLIWIYLESMETTMFSRQNGGAFDQSRIPELEALAVDKRNLSFSHSNIAGGITKTAGSYWTVGALAAQSSGIPIKPVSGIGENSLGDFEEFLPGAYGLGEVLKDNGYKQKFIIGSDASFGGRDKLWQQHGEYEVFDFKTAKQKGLISEDYKVFWGYEDKKLFSFAKTELTNLAKNDQPFNFQLLTVDTHFVDGYLDPSCPQPFTSQYENVYACSSKMINDFVSWLKQQPFYDNTTVVITGDHLGMQTEFYEQFMPNQNYQRAIYNVFINSKLTTAKTKNRQASAFDMYPTVLASIGIKIDGDQMALGTNLDSSKPTLFEKYDDYNYVNQELEKKSSYYNQKILTNF